MADALSRAREKMAAGEELTEEEQAAFARWVKQHKSIASLPNVSLQTLNIFVPRPGGKKFT